jgi:AmmeMemoRadiSam system protein A
MADTELGQALLIRARNAIALKLGAATAAEPAHPQLSQRGACFVTLTHDGALRGCIGTLAAHRLLDEDVRANAAAAAFHDPRFPPLGAAEFPVVRVEVSLLGTPKALPVRSKAEALARLRPGIDGVILSCGGRRATFLPQVWDDLSEPAVFLHHLQRKAGLSGDDWSPDSQLQTYTVEKWKEAKP